MTPFEKRLAETPLRPIPPEWRREILAAAQVPRSCWSFAALLPAIQNPKSKIQNLLWPHPYAWAALAACWIVIATLSFSGPRGPELYAVTPKGMTPVNISPETYVAHMQLRDAMLARAFPPETPVVIIDRRKL